MRATFRSMGCVVVVAGAEDTTPIEALFAQYDAVFSRFRADSELNRINAAGAAVVSPLFAETLRTALWAARSTDSLVDPTLGTAVEAAGYDRDFEELGADPRPPGPAAPGSWRSIRLIGSTVLLPRDLRLDLNGVVKALAVDAAADRLPGDGFVSAGGDLATRGPVDVALPGGDTIRLVAGGLATSGSTRRSWMRAGEPQHHLIDPRTGRPAETPWAEVTVAGKSCLDADVAAKAAFLLGAEGPAWLDARDLPGRFLGHDGEVVASAAWREAVPCT